MFFILVNVFLAILNDNYGSVKSLSRRRRCDRRSREERIAAGLEERIGFTQRVEATRGSGAEARRVAESRPNPNPWLNSAGVGLGERPSFNVAILAERREWRPRPPNPGPNAVRNFMHRLSYDLEMKAEGPSASAPEGEPSPAIPTHVEDALARRRRPVPQGTGGEQRNWFAAAPLAPDGQRVRHKGWAANAVPAAAAADRAAIGPTRAAPPRCAAAAAGKRAQHASLAKRLRPRSAAASTARHLAGRLQGDHRRREYDH